MASMAEKYPIFSVLKGDGTSVQKDREPSVPDAQLRKMYSTMVATRLLNERGMLLQRQGRIGFYIGSEGQEAIPIGTAPGRQPPGWYSPHYRDLGFALYRADLIKPMVQQLYGPSKDLTKGKQMPNHFSFKDQHF